MSFLSSLFQSKASNARPLENPDHRKPIRDNFPGLKHVIGTDNKAFKVDVLLNTVAQQLELQDQQLSNIDHITIAYPHKARDWKGKPHNLVAKAEKFAATLQNAMPNVNWIVADGLCETRHLNRSGRKAQGMINTLRKKHRFDFIEGEQKTDLPFIRPDHSGPSYFILFDDVCEQGTTAASMINFIHHNNGYVLAAATMTRPGEIGPVHLRQYNDDTKAAFRNAAYNKGVIPVIAEALSYYIWRDTCSTQIKDYVETHIENYVQELDQALHQVGLSLPALTIGECNSLVEYFRAQPIPYKKFIAALTQESSFSGAVKAELQHWSL